MPGQYSWLVQATDNRQTWVRVPVLVPASTKSGETTTRQVRRDVEASIRTDREICGAMQSLITGLQVVTAGSRKTFPLSGRSSVWLERLIWVQEAGGSSPFARTTHLCCCGFMLSFLSQNRHLQQISIIEDCRFESCGCSFAFWRKWFTRLT